MKLTKINKGTFYLGDCMDLMKDTPDNFYELAIVDPPYAFGDTIYNLSKVVNNKTTSHNEKKWNDIKPPKKYFKELFRVSKNQIIWGANYFSDCLPPSRGWIFWDKKYVGMHSFADGEFAFSSFDKNAQKFTYRKPKKIPAIHPTQKPVALYKWLLKNYAKEGDKILDTHLGSGSIAIASHYMGFELTGIEIDEEYYNKAMTRIKEQTQQGTLI